MPERTKLHLLSIHTPWLERVGREHLFAFFGLDFFVKRSTDMLGVLPVSQRFRVEHSNCNDMTLTPTCTT